MIVGAAVLIGCSSPKVAKYETIAYRSASPENRLKIEQGEIAAGMSIEECKAACPECRFVKKFESTRGDFDLWEVTGPDKDLYLHVQKGRIEKVSANKPQPSPTKRPDDKDPFFRKKSY